MLLNRSHTNTQDSPVDTTPDLLATLGISILYGLAASLFFFTKRIKRPPGKSLDIEVRYNTERNADTTFLVQNLVKIIRIVLSPLETKINKEDAKLIFVYADDGWEMRVRNGSENLRRSVRRLLEAKEW